MAEAATGAKPGYGVLYCFEFGNGFQTVTPGFEPVSRVYRTPRHLRICDVRDVTRSEESDPLSRFRPGFGGRVLGVLRWRLRHHLGDGLFLAPHGPFTIYLQDQVVEANVMTSPGQVLVRSFPAHVSQGKLRLKFRAQAGKDFVLNRMLIQGPPGKAEHSLFADAPLDYFPTVEEVLRRAIPMRKIPCANIVIGPGRRPPNGFIGDAARPGPHTHYYWYTPRIPFEPCWRATICFALKYLDAVVTILDKLIDEQLPNGAWQQVFRDKPTRADVPGGNRCDPEASRWVNTADIGSIVTALAVSCRYVSPERRRAYTEAARRYCDDWACKWQLPSGAFTNGLEAGIPRLKPTAWPREQAAAFAAVYAITREPRYLQRAQQAAELLLDSWQPEVGPFPSGPFRKYGHKICAAGHPVWRRPLLSRWDSVRLPSSLISGSARKCARFMTGTSTENEDCSPTCKATPGGRCKTPGIIPNRPASASSACPSAHGEDAAVERAVGLMQNSSARLNSLSVSARW